MERVTEHADSLGYIYIYIDIHSVGEHLNIHKVGYIQVLQNKKKKKRPLMMVCAIFLSSLYS